MQMHKPEAVLLDWDDCLIDSTHYYMLRSEAAMDTVIKELHLAPPPVPYRARQPLTSSEYFRKYFDENVALRFEEVREEMLMDSTLEPPFLKPGAKELLRFLQMNHIPYAIVSDTPDMRLRNNVERTLNAAGLPVPVMVGTNGDGDRKPKPDGIFRALRHLSEAEGREIAPSERVIMLGDKPLKDGMAAKNAGITPFIVRHEHSGPVDGWPVFEELNDVTFALARTHFQELRRPRFIKRDPYHGIPREETEIIAGDKDFIESPLQEALDDPHAYTPEDRELHNLRWIAKRAQNLDGTGSYSRTEQMEAAHAVVERLLTEPMLEALTQRTITAVAHKREEEKLSLDEEVVVHLPHRLVNPPKLIENMLSVAYNHELAEKLNAIFTERYPELHVRFDSHDRLLSGLSIERSEELHHPGEPVTVTALSDHNAKSTAQAGRSTGTLLDRIVKQPIFDYSTFKKGDLTIITDDHVQGGGTFITWYHALKQLGVTPIAFTALSTMPESKNFQPHPEMPVDMRQAMQFALQHYMQEFPHADPAKTEQKFDRALDGFLGKVGLSVGTLANREALTIMAYLIDGRDPVQRNWFERVARTYGADPEMVERKDESLMAQAHLAPVTPVELQERVEKLIPKYTVSYAR